MPPAANRSVPSSPMPRRPVTRPRPAVVATRRATVGSRRQSVVVTVPEIFRDRPFLRSRARVCRVGWFTAGENFPSRPSPPDDARSGPGHGASRHSEPNGGSPARCAPHPGWSIVAVAFTTTPWRGWESSSSAMDARISVEHARITVARRGGEGLSAPEAFSHGALARFGTILSWCLSGELAELLRRVCLVLPPDSSRDVTHRVMSRAKQPRHLPDSEGDQVGDWG